MKTVIAANRGSDVLRAVHDAGIGHEFRVDEPARFSQGDRDGLIQFLLLFFFYEPGARGTRHLRPRSQRCPDRCTSKSSS